MLNETFKCETCGANLEEYASKSTNGLVQCPHCYNVWTIPKKETNPAALSFLRMGEHDLDTCKFDEAYEAYKKAAEHDFDEPEAFWGMALAKFKVQYLKDEVNNCLQPICHEVTENKFTDDPDYMRAFMKATPEQREEYAKRAKDIDYIQSEFSKLEKTGLDYDCFICVKVTDEKGEPTEDSKDATWIYKNLIDKGYQPFYSEYVIRNKQGADYEAHILYALYKSECMLVVCRDESYLQTKWVKNEYTRFLKLVNDEEKESDSITIVFYKNVIEKLPGRKGKLQGIDFSQRSADGQIIEFVENHTPNAKRKREEAAAAKLREEEERKRRNDELLKLVEEQRKELEKQREENEKRQALEEERRQREKLNSSFAAGFSDMSDDELLLRMERAREERERKKREEAERIAREKAEAERIAREEAERVAKENWIRENDPTVTLYNTSEFEIDGTILKKYKWNKTVIKIPLGVTSIGDCAFRDCTNLKSITIPDSVTSIGYEAFSGCARLASITIPDNVTSIGESAFFNCTSLTSITIPSSVTSIGRRAFEDCTNLERVYITDIAAWCNIGFGDFRANPLGYAQLYLNNKLVTNITADMLHGVTEIKDHAFGDCTNLKSITIPDGVTSIGAFAFAYCESLKSITIPNSVTSIGGWAFRDCTNLERVYITDIAAWCNIEFDDNVLGVDGVNPLGYAHKLYLNNKLVTEITADMLQGVTEIKDCAFFNCTSLKSITIPDSVISIGESAFFGTSLESITIPNGVTSIGYCAFYGCKNLIINCRADKKPTGWNKNWAVVKEKGLFKIHAKVIWGYKG